MKDKTLSLIKELLKVMGDNPEREGLKDTPKRILKSYSELYAGYLQNPKDILKTTFKEGTCKEMVILKDVEFYSTCEHHVLPFFGICHIGYIPNKKVVGVSKLARLIDCFSKRLQIQERMTTQIAEAIMQELDAKGCIVVCEAQHMCMTSRGIKKQSSKMITSAIRGIFEQEKVRMEFLELIK